MNDFEFADVSANNITFYNKYGSIINKTAIVLESINKDVSKEGKPHYMLKEIFEIKKSLNNIISTYSNMKILSKVNKIINKNIKRIKIIGCGTAYHSGLLGAELLEQNLQIETTCHIASEFRYANPILNKDTLCIFVSQSGETADTIACLNLAKKKKCQTLSITNVNYSTLAKNTNIVLPICAGPEIAVASTKAYVCQIAIFYCLAKYMRNIILNKNYAFINNLKRFTKQLDINKYVMQIQKIAKNLVNSNKVFFIGRNEDYVTAKEAELKLKEVSYLNSYSYPSGELKHGFLALVENDTPIIVFATNKKIFEKTINGANEASARGGKIILVSQFDTTNYNCNIVEHIKLQTKQKDLFSIEAIIPLQLLAYYTSVYKNLNPDKPRNLAKSVTVE